MITRPKQMPTTPVRICAVSQTPQLRSPVMAATTGTAHPAMTSSR